MNTVDIEWIPLATCSCERCERAREIESRGADLRKYVMHGSAVVFGDIPCDNEPCTCGSASSGYAGKAVIGDYTRVCACDEDPTVEVEQAHPVSAFDVVGDIEFSSAGVTFKVNDRRVIMVRPWVGESALDFMRRLDAIAGTIATTLDAAFLVEDE